MGCLMAMLGVFVVPFAAACVFFLVLGVREANTQLRLNTAAIEVPARVMEAEIQRLSIGSSQNKPTYSPRIVYEYELDGNRFQGDQVWPIRESVSDQGWVKSIVRRYPVGSDTMAWVDPSDPSSAFLERRWSIMPYVSSLGASSMLTLITAAGVWIVGWRYLTPFGLIAIGASLVSASAAGWLGWSWWTQVPADAKPGWLDVAIGTAGFISLTPVIMLFRARAGARLYRQALAVHATTRDRGADEQEGEH